MKTIQKTLYIFVLLLSTFAFAQSTKIEAWVNGDCGMCKERIEKTAKKNGATSANWNDETKMLNVEFDAAKTSLDKILEDIAAVGHDNEKYKAKDEVYEKLSGCCHYERVSPPVKNSTESPNNATPVEVKKEDDDPHAGHDHAKKEEVDEHAGYDHKKDQIRNSNIEGVTVTKAQATTALSRKSADLTFKIDQKELLKAACCNLSESFETNATVDVSFSNAVTGAKQLKMLGLDQKYTALTKELLPEIRGLASAYGLNFIPGRWIGGIQLTKGGSTVTSGYEGITGQINTELLKFNKTPETNLNVFADFQGRTELNLTQTSQINEHWDQSILLHGNGTFGNIDDNNDGFLDRPKGNQLNAAYLLNFNDLGHSGFGSHFGITFLKDNRKAGQTNYDWNLPQSQQSAYGVGIDTQRFQVWNKTGFVFPGRPYQSLGWMNQFTYHQQNSFYGLRNYNGNQKTFYSNLIYEDMIVNTNHKYKLGASFLMDLFDENYLTQLYKRTETVPGAFAEYTMTGDKFTLVAGARVDFHNLAGTQFSPRLNLKYDILPKTIVRLSAGKGFRTANVFAENQHYFASNRVVDIHANGGNIYGLKPEVAWNYGASLQQEFKLFNRKATLVADFFRTDFQNQVLVDLDNPQKLSIYNLDGKSFANSFQTQLDFSPVKNLDLRVAYKYYDVQADYHSGRKEVPFMAKNRGFFNAAYATNKNAKDAFWSFDTTLQFVGKQRLPDTTSNPTAFQLAPYSKEYVTLNAQVAYQFNKNIRAYFGGENLTGYEQMNPIMDVKNPFGSYFDSSLIYAPIMPANFYVGFDVKF
ncbi:TonB-dependent receptor domain-containing protein [Amniculibacterium sp. G2-70]|uniref:TonB-dependent receptor domain-containing protein n=1 Tax=Amniculibacterium sp. G2-70 TaxID=2767188 RepID=UPI001654A3D7|nr:TonB-dependent receptor [Amniculibacterium sp. G2-70]